MNQRAQNAIRWRIQPPAHLLLLLTSAALVCGSPAALATTPPVSITPVRASLVSHQALVLTANAGVGYSVAWTATGANCSGSACGSFSAGATASGVPVTYNAPGVAGIYTITATNTTDSSRSASMRLAVTDLAGVTTWHNNVSRDGANTREFSLNPVNVASHFGKLFSCAVDGAVYAQPLWMPALSIGGKTHNVVFVATQHDSLYAFDADAAPAGCKPLWHANLIASAHGAGTGESAVPSSGPGALVGSGYGDIAPEVGVTGTPVIDPASGTLYVVSKSVIRSSRTFFQRLHAIDIHTGAEKFSGPVTISATYPGSGDGGSTDTFSPGQQSQRAGLALVNGVVYIAWASHEDRAPYYGWVIGYNAQTLTQVGVFNATPDSGYGGIWMGGAAPSADFGGNLFLITGNGNFDANQGSPPNHDFGDSLLKLTSALKVSQSFTPSDQYSDNMNDNDFGSGGTAILVNLPANGTNPTQLLIGGGKDGALYVLNRQKLGGVGDAKAWQRVATSASIFSTGAYWNSTFYIACVGGPMSAYPLNAATARLNASPASTSAGGFGFPGSTPSISALGNFNGILWALDNGNYCTSQSNGCGPAVLHAFDASNLAKEIWNSSMNVGDAAGNAVKFTVPTIANGRVYVGTRGNNTGGADSSTSTPGELDVYGLLPK